MKLIMAIVHNDDSPILTAQLTKKGFNVTKIATTGGFLMAGNTTLITGVDENKVDDVINIISRYSCKRSQPAPPDSSIAVKNSSSGDAAPRGEIRVGGATIFVLNVERFEHV